MKFAKSHYRDVVSLVEIMPGVQKILDLTQIPHHTTIQKFAKRFSKSKIDALIAVHSMNKFESILGIDASGFSSDNASKYYAVRIKGDCPMKHYVKDSICVDVFTKLITSCVVDIGPRNDNVEFIPVLQKSKIAPVVVVADKGYDSEKNHKYVNSLNAVSMIPVKRNVRRGKYRMKMKKKFSERIYHKRSVTETVFSVMKRKFGSDVYAKSDEMRIIEVYWINFTYNLHRLVQMQVGFIWMISTEPREARIRSALSDIHSECHTRDCEVR